VAEPIAAPVVASPAGRKARGGAREGVDSAYGQPNTWPYAPVPVGRMPAAWGDAPAPGAKIRDWDSFMAARGVACQAAIAAFGRAWATEPGASVMATVPAAWVACRVFGRVARMRRDLRLPAARFWPGGTLPSGPVYGAPDRLETAPVLFGNTHANPCGPAYARWLEAFDRARREESAAPATPAPKARGKARLPETV
jgi:hypothetical protein